MLLLKGVILVSKHKKNRRCKKNSPPHKAHSIDRHHLCYQRGDWNHNELLLLRDFWYCVVPIPRETVHKSIHALVPTVPPPRDVSAKYALDQLRYLDNVGAITENDTIERRLELLVFLFDYIEQPTADAFRKQLKIVCEYQKAPK